MKFYFVLLLLCLALAVRGQQENGIRFEDLSNWQSVLDKAKIENKMIFVDCFATWCGPCKAMEQTTFKDPKIGKLVNSHFISIRLQIDSSKKDDENARNWYATAGDFKKRYEISAFPSFLFFNSDGTAVHKDIGYKKDSDFVVLCQNALSPDSQYYARIELVKTGHTTDSAIRSLLDYTSKIGDNVQATKLAKLYVNNYLDKLDRHELINKANLDFLVTYRESVTSKDPVFRVIYDDQSLVDSIYESRIAGPLTDEIINSEEIKPAVSMAKSGGTSPNWVRLHNAVKTKYNSETADRVIVSAKVSWFRYKKEWQLYSTFLLKKTQFFVATNPPPGFSTMIALNNNAWQIFLHSKKKEELLEAVKWADLAMPMEHPQTFVMIDTKANLLYKAGKKREAINLEKRALEISKNDPVVAATLTKMQAGKSTWDVKQ